jgi:hypothetical protein
VEQVTEEIKGLELTPENVELVRGGCGQDCGRGRMCMCGRGCGCGWGCMCGLARAHNEINASLLRCRRMCVFVCVL